MGKKRHQHSGKTPKEQINNLQESLLESDFMLAEVETYLIELLT